MAIVGAGALPVGRHSPPRGARAAGFELELLLRVAWDALREADVPPSDVGSLVLTLPPPSTRQLGLATLLAAQLGLACTGRVAETVQMGITGGLAFDQVAADIALGECRFALAAGVALDGAVGAAEAADHGMRAVGDVDFQSPFGITPIAWYAFDAMRYLHETGATRRELAAVAVKSRHHARANPLAQQRGKPITVEQVLAERPVVEPLGLLDVPPRGEGAVALLLADADAARELGRPFVVVRGRGFAHDGRHQIGDRAHDMTDFVALRDATQRCLRDAGRQMADLQLAELYAPCTITEVLAAESLGISARGRGGADAAEGATAVGGRLPLNTSGGCLARGHPPSLTGLYGLVELREQLLGRAGERQVRDARCALHSCEGGNYNLALVHLLERAA